MVTAVRKLCQMLQISANGRSQNQKPTEVRNQVLSSPSQCLPDEVTSVSGHKRFEKPRCSPSVVADKKSTPHVSGFSNLRKNMYDNETTTCKDNADEFEVGEINKSDKKDNSKKVEDGIFSNVSLPQSKTNSEKIMWKVLK